LNFTRRYLLEMSKLQQTLRVCLRACFKRSESKQTVFKLSPPKSSEIFRRSRRGDSSSLTKIIRQRTDVLRHAVFDLSQGIHELENKAERLAAIAQTHLAVRKEGKSSDRCPYP